MIASNSVPASFFNFFAHSYTQCIVCDIITQFMTLFKRKRQRKILKLKYIESERKKSHSTRFAKQNFVFVLMQLWVLQDNLGPLLAVWVPPIGDLGAGCYGSAPRLRPGLGYTAPKKHRSCSEPLTTLRTF